MVSCNQLVNMIKLSHENVSLKSRPPVPPHNKHPHIIIRF